MRSIGRFELRTLIGQGSMGQVWQSWDTQLKRPTAVKIINPDRLIGQADSISPEVVAARFCREAELGARFAHPGLPMLYDARLNGSPSDLYMVWELVVGQNLAQILAAEGGRLPVNRALYLAAQIANTLACIHEDPVIHRDLKPSNVMITEDWKTKLLDFGVAAVYGGDYPRLTQDGQILGTVAYMAPEQFADRGLILPQTDLYALGCLLYEMLTGQPPFTGDPASVMDAHRTRTPIPVRELRPDIPPDVNDLLMSLLVKDTASRPDSAHQIVEQLALHTTLLAPAVLSADNEGDQAEACATIPAAATQLPVTIRIVQAQALFDAGHFGEALPVYNALCAELATAGDSPRQAAECRAKAAFCHLRLGNLRQALTEYTALAVELPQDASPEDHLLLEVRSRVGLLQAASNKPEEALVTFAGIYSLLIENLGHDDPLTTEVRTVFNRLNRLGGIFPRPTPAPVQQSTT
ncbi:serine/threonine-protein kinase [Streptomyces sp. EN27]|uniref:serine/threonine-protein kinase n=1 Tax=Streptomyces sp. EN27 TaxID=211464 RepID=UPI0008518C90|nr:serine/threonine-protein kinase [Streptomyces sp. EN27]